MAASPPAPIPMSAAAMHPKGKLLAHASRKIPAAVVRFTTSATRAPKNRSCSPQPTTILPSRLEPPSMDAHNAASLGVIPRSVSNADSCVIAPFILDKLSLANCHFAQDSSGFPILLPFCDVRSARRSHPPLYMCRSLSDRSRLKSCGSSHCWTEWTEKRCG
jgi:hypothetical protein